MKGKGRVSGRKGRRKNQIQDSSPSPSRRQLERIQARGMIEQALRGERFGKHPGEVEIRIQFHIYNPITKQNYRLPGMNLELLAGSYEDAVEMREVVAKALVDWIAGLVNRIEVDTI